MHFQIISSRNLFFLVMGIFLTFYSDISLKYIIKVKETKN